MANILLLEDHSGTRQAIVDQLGRVDRWFLFVSTTLEEAVSLLRSGPIDVIVADLRTLDAECGVFIRHAAPTPVIVTSDRDGQAGVIDALEAGAVNYIPGHFREQRLVTAVRAALASALESSRRARLLGAMEHSHSRFSIPTELSMLTAAADRLQASLEMFGLCDPSQSMHVRIALDEALANAFYHGNLEVSSELKEFENGNFEKVARQRQQLAPYRDRRITIEEYLDRQHARFVIRDEGPGFDVAGVPDPARPDRIGRCSGRGIAMMRHFLDDVRFNEIGNEVTLVKRCTTFDRCSADTVGSVGVTPPAHSASPATLVMSGV